MEKIEHIQYINAPVQTVFDALSTQQGLGSIWTNRLIVKPEIGFINEFDFNDNFGTKFKVVELIPNERILWECIASDPEWVGTTVSFDIVVKDSVVSVVLRHSKWRELTEFYRWCNYNWAMFLYSLKTYCEDGKGLPFQERKF